MASLNGDTKIIVDLINLRIDGVEKRIERIDSNLTAKVHDHCGRIKIIETAKTHTKGFIAGMVLVISVIISSVWAIFTHLTGN